VVDHAGLEPPNSRRPGDYRVQHVDGIMAHHQVWGAKVNLQARVGTFALLQALGGAESSRHPFRAGFTDRVSCSADVRRRPGLWDRAQVRLWRRLQAGWRVLGGETTVNIASAIEPSQVRIGIQFESLVTVKAGASPGTQRRQQIPLSPQAPWVPRTVELVSWFCHQPGG